MICDIEVIKRKMLVKYPFFGSVVANVNYQALENIPTAGTDGETIYYNPNFLNKLTTDEQIFIFAHEVCHIAFDHILRSEGKDAQIWNIATDAVINAFLKNDGLKMIDGGVDIPEAIKYNAEELYEELLKQKEKNQEQSSSEKNNSDSNNSPEASDSNNQSTQNDSSDSDCKSNNIKENEKQPNEESKNNNDKDNNDVGHDTHKMWKDAVKQNNDKKEEKDSGSSKQDKKESKISEKEIFKENKGYRKQQLEQLKKELASQASGKSTNQELRKIDDIGSAKPLIHWRYILRQAIKYDVDWSYKNATIEDGIVMANLEELPQPETEILVDTSGSIDSTLLRNFLRECKNILKQSKVKVGCFDTRFYGFNEIRTEKDINEMEFVGGGGTDFDVAVNAFSN